jgi:hypothetical protein
LKLGFDARSLVKMSRHFRAAMVGSLLVLCMAPGGFCLRRALAQEKGQVLKIEGDLKTMQGQWISKDGQGAESVWNFKEETDFGKSYSFDLKKK